MLKIRNLTASADGKTIIDQVNLEIKPGEIHVLLGPNGSGKSSLAQVIMGNPHFKIEQGEIWFKDQNITELSMEQRAKLGLALSFQDPPAIKGVTLKNLLDILSEGKLGKNKPDKSESALKLDQLPATKKLLNRDLNQKFSGGEKKIAELLQILALNPELIIFDELDSGLDLKNLELILDVIKTELIKQEIPLMFITHHGQIIDGMEPDWTHVMLDKKIICDSQDYQKVIRTIKQHGYQKCRACQSMDRR